MAKFQKDPQTANAIKITVTTMNQTYVIEFTSILKETKSAY